MRTLKNFNFKDKRVLVRCDFNVPLSEQGNILDDFRIKQTLPTIEYLIKKKAKIILMSHLGRPEGKVVKNLRLNKVRDKLMKYLNLSVIKTENCIGKEVKDLTIQMQPGEIILLENVQFHPGEKKNDLDLAKTLASYADIFIMEAFGQAHRNYASIASIPKYLPSGAGFLLEKEIKILSKILEKPWRPLVVIIGGIKIATKIKVIKKILRLTDHLLLGGEIANLILIVKGICLGKPLPEPKVIEKIKKINLTNPKIHLPVDAVISLEDIKKGLEEGYIRQAGLGVIRKEEKAYDVGLETIKIFSEIIKSAKMILWSGPLGMYEEGKFERGTKEIAKNIAKNYSAFKIAGGGDTISAILKFGLINKFDHISTGGGAMLAFLSGEKLPGIEALKEKSILKGYSIL